jgi:uncharacterized spore protein YtfJ
MGAGSLLEKVGDNLSVRRAFGPAYEKDGTLIIPVAMVAGGGGGGVAHPRSGQAAPPDGVVREDSPPEPSAAPPEQARMDAGGGFGGLVLPVGVYVVKGDQVRWIPAVDVTIGVLASLSLVRILARTWSHWRRPHCQS